MTPVLKSPQGRCCIIQDPEGEMVAECVVGGTGPASITAARKGADQKADEDQYTGHRNYEESVVTL
jgi:hypothetical protein